MTTQNTKRARDEASASETTSHRLGRIGLAVLSFLAGIIFGLVIQRAFIRLIPGPNTVVDINGSRLISGNAAGCIAYSFRLSTDGEIDNAYLKLQFPNTITDHEIGFALEGHTNKTDFAGMQAWELGRNSRGECDIAQTLVKDETDIASSAAGNMVRVSISKFPEHSVVVGVAVTPTFGSAVQPASKYFEGYYEYSFLGQPVRKSLKFIDEGIVDSK